MTVLVAILLALGVPFAQLHTETVRVLCCCPDPDDCHCPDHDPDKNGESHVSACHKEVPDLLRPHMPAFVTAPLVRHVVLVELAGHVEHVLPAPHPSPPPRRPDAPS